ncbi:MAG: hypothetical protein P1V97_27935 [Planctomycetota bacterium]|nr:hypothetical protein [Planctomycetota bacterium]
MQEKCREILNRVLIVGEFNGRDVQRGGFYAFNGTTDQAGQPKSYGNLITRGGNLRFQSFKDAVKPQHKTIQTGVLGPGNWFFEELKKGDRESYNGQEPGRMILGRLRDQLGRFIEFRGQLDSLLANFLDRLSSRTDGIEIDWSRGDALPVGFFKFFTDQILEGNQLPRSVNELPNGQSDEALAGWSAWIEERKLDEGKSDGQLLISFFGILEEWLRNHYTQLSGYRDAVTEIREILHSKILIDLAVQYPFEHLMKRVSAAMRTGAIKANNHQDNPYFEADKLNVVFDEGKYASWEYQVSWSRITGKSLTTLYPKVGEKLDRFLKEFCETTDFPILADPRLTLNKDKREAFKDKVKTTIAGIFGKGETPERFADLAKRVQDVMTERELTQQVRESFAEGLESLLLEETFPGLFGETALTRREVGRQFVSRFIALYTLAAAPGTEKLRTNFRLLGEQNKAGFESSVKDGDFKQGEEDKLYQKLIDGIEEPVRNALTPEYAKALNNAELAAATYVELLLNGQVSFSEALIRLNIEAGGIVSVKNTVEQGKFMESAFSKNLSTLFENAAREEEEEEVELESEGEGAVTAQAQASPQLASTTTSAHASSSNVPSKSPAGQATPHTPKQNTSSSIKRVSLKSVRSLVSSAREKLQSETAEAPDAKTVASEALREKTPSSLRDVLYEGSLKIFKDYLDNADSAEEGIQKRNRWVLQTVLEEFLLYYDKGIGLGGGDSHKLGIMEDMLGCHDVKEFLSKFSLTKYFDSDSLGDERALQRQVRSFARLARTHLSGLRHILSELYGLEHLFAQLEGSQDSEIILYNGNADDFWSEVTNSHYSGGTQFFNPATIDNNNFILPHCIYFTNLAFVENGTYKQNKKVSFLQSLKVDPLSAGAVRVALPPMLMTLGQDLGDKEPGDNPLGQKPWFKAEQVDTDLLSALPIHLVGPSRFLRHQKDDAFSTVRPVGYEILVSLLGKQNGDERYTKQSRATPDTAPIKTFLLSQKAEKVDNQIHERLFSVIDKDTRQPFLPSWTTTIFLYFTIIDVLKKAAGSEIMPTHFSEVVFNLVTEAKITTQRQKEQDRYFKDPNGYWKSLWFSDNSQTPSQLYLKLDTTELKLKFDQFSWFVDITKKYQSATPIVGPEED